MLMKGSHPLRNVPGERAAALHPRDRKPTEADLVDNQFAAAVDGLSDAVLITDSQGIVLSANPAYGEITGYSGSDAIGKNLCGLLLSECDAETRDDIWRTVQDGKVWAGTLCCRKKDGTAADIEANLSPVFSATGEITNYVAVVRAVICRGAMEAQQHTRDRMEAVGRLAGGFAHQFNNLLQVVIGHASLAMTGTHPDSESYRDMERVRQAAEKAGRFLQTNCSHTAAAKFWIFMMSNLNEWLTGLGNPLCETLGGQIELDLIPGFALGAVRVDRNALEQVLLQLCINARDAMPDGGTLTVETENVIVNGYFCRAHPWAKPGRYVLLSVTDCGVGMSPEVMEHVFEPFFTTKEVGQGIGLGLSVAYGIIKQQDGMIHVYSEKGKGTTFKIYLPVAERAAGTIGDKIGGPIPRGSETVLVVDDEENARHIAAHVLRGNGYNVILAKSGEEAVRAFETCADGIDCVLLDVFMPALNGSLTRDRIVELNPRVPILFCSGYSSNSAQAASLKEEAGRILTKPYNPCNLLCSIRELLDSSKNAS